MRSGFTSSLGFAGNILFTVLVISACSYAYQQPGDDDAGPFPTEYKQIVDDWLSKNLKDPTSLTDLEITPPVEGDFLLAPVSGRKLKAYMVCVKYNAKNSFGGYVGRQPYVFVIRDSRVITTENLNRPKRYPYEYLFPYCR